MASIHSVLFSRFLRIGLIAWGGPVAQLSLIREEAVTKQGWLSADEFKRALAVYQVLPGPEAHEMCVYIGMKQGGRLGAVLSGLGFMLPGLLLMLGLCYLYLSFGGSALLALLGGILPVVAAIVVRALCRIGGHVLHGRFHKLLAFYAVAYTLAGGHFAPLLIACGLAGMLESRGRLGLASLLLFAAAALPLAQQFYGLPALTLASHSAATSTPLLFWEGLKAGMLSFGGAYTVIPFLQESATGAHGWMSSQQFMDGIALSNVIPAPLVIFGTFVGFIGGALPGALALTAGIFLPAFAFTLLGHTQLERIIQNRAWHHGLDGVAAAVVGILAVTALHICLLNISSIGAGIIFALALAALFKLKHKLTTPLLILLGALGTPLISALSFP